MHDNQLSFSSSPVFFLMKLIGAPQGLQGGLDPSLQQNIHLIIFLPLLIQLQTFYINACSEGLALRKSSIWCTVSLSTGMPGGSKISRNSAINLSHLEGVWTFSYPSYSLWPVTSPVTSSLWGYNNISHASSTAFFLKPFVIYYRLQSSTCERVSR